MSSALGIDIGGSSLKAARVRGEGRTFVIEERGSRPLGGSDRDEAGMVSAVLDLCRSMGLRDHEGVGVAVAGNVRASDGVISASANFPAWANFDLAGRLSDALGRCVKIDNDANAFTRAESACGAAEAMNSSLGITLGTGVGGGLCIGGVVYRGHRGFATEIGHVCIERQGLPCGCGGRGCLEQYASSQWLLAAAADQLPRRFADSNTDEVGKRLSEVARGSDGESETARAIFEEMGESLAIGVAGILHVIDVEGVVVGGGLEAAYEFFGPKFEATLKRRVFPGIAADLVIKRAALGREAGSVGAAVLACSSE